MSVVPPEETISHRGGLIFSKLTLMLILLVFDLGLNCSIDYDSYNNQPQRNFIMGMLFLNVVVEISIFLIIFLAMASTYIFRVGLLGVLLKQFQTTFIIHFIYLTFTIVTGAYRFNELIRKDNDIVGLYHDPIFISLSTLQKCCKYLYPLKSVM